MITQRLITSLFASAVAVAASVVAAAPTGSLPTVASINVCADQLLLELADRSQIRSLTYLASDPAASHHSDRAAGMPSNDGSAEPIIALMPDIVIVGQYSDRYTVRLLEARGLQVRVLPVADSVDAVLSNLTRVGEWIGRAAEARSRVDALQQRLDALAQRRAAARDTPALQAAIYDPNGYTVGPASLRGEMLARAGFANVAEAAGIEGYGSLALESLLRHVPDVLVDSPYSPGTWSRAQALSLHPALRARGLNPATVTFDSADTLCGGPWTVELIERLADEHHALRAQRQP